MSRSLHWALLVGCGAIVGLNAKPAWEAVCVCELPSDCRPASPWMEAFLGGERQDPTERLGSLEAESEPVSVELVADRS